METEKIKEIITNRYNSLTQFEKSQLISLSFHTDVKLIEYFDGIRKNIVWESAYAWSLLGRRFARAKAKAETIMKTEKKLRYVMRNIKQRSGGFHYRHDGITEMYDKGVLTPTILCFMFQRLSQSTINLLDAYSHDPIYSVGEIVQFRSNIGVDSVLEVYSNSNGKYYHGCGRSKLKTLKDKTFMIIQIDPEIEGKNYAKAYSYHDKQGGSRIYKVLPIGSTETYFVIEKFLKKCRTKAVKDARK